MEECKATGRINMNIDDADKDASPATGQAPLRAAPRARAAAGQAGKAPERVCDEYQLRCKELFEVHVPAEKKAGNINTDKRWGGELAGLVFLM